MFLGAPSSSKKIRAQLTLALRSSTTSLYTTSDFLAALTTPDELEA
jgi:hypothetical protein